MMTAALLLVGLGVPADPAHTERADLPDLSQMIPILDETFDGPLNRYDTQKGLWWTLGRRSVLMTNAAHSVFLDRGVLEGQQNTLPVLHETGPEGLSLRTARLSPSVLERVRRYMAQTGQGALADQVRYATSRISTERTWAQSYGYFEIEARIPRGRGRWPAFWLSMAGPGWPPEIDIFEAYGAGMNEPTKKDDTFSTSVFFDAYNDLGEAVHSTELRNSFAGPDVPDQPDVKTRAGRDIFSFARTHHAKRSYSADIYSGFHVWAALWTPADITFYFGPDRASLREIFRTPTPDDLHVPQYMIANDQFTARGGWWQPRAGMLGAVLDPGNAFVIRRIRILAMPPTHMIELGTTPNAFDPRASLIRDTTGDDIIAPGDGLDIIELTGGEDRIELSRGRHGTIISGFGADDHITFEGDVFRSARDAFTRLTQVGDDVWLPNGGDGGWPQSVIFRAARVADFRPDQFGIRWPITPDLHWSDASHPQTMLKDSDGDGVLVAPYSGARMTDAGHDLNMTGSQGPDRYFVQSRDSTINEKPDGGTDTVVTGVTLDIPANVENAIGQSPGIWIRGGDADERLTAEAERMTLVGRGGDDLFVIRPGLLRATVRIRPGDGHDWIRGFSPEQHVLELLDVKGPLDVEQGPSGALITLGPEQTLLLENVSVHAARDILDRSLAH